MGGADIKPNGMLGAGAAPLDYIMMKFGIVATYVGDSPACRSSTVHFVDRSRVGITAVVAQRIGGTLLGGATDDCPGKSFAFLSSELHGCPQNVYNEQPLMPQQR